MSGSVPRSAAPTHPARAAAPARARHLGAVWVLLGALIAAEMANEVFGLPGPAALFQDWIHDGVIAAAAVLCLARARDDRRSRAAWLAFGTGLACWAVGSIVWSVLYSADAEPPNPTVADLLWLAWYPCTALGVALLIRGGATRFELHRWMDGLAVMLIVLTPAAALVLQPVAEQSDNSLLTTTVDFAYPILDVLLIGAILGVFGLMGWRPGRTWLILGAGCVVIAASDAIFAVQQARGGLLDGDYDFLWPMGAVLIAFAAWSPATRKPDEEPVLGWRAIALPLAAQVLAASIQVFSLFHELGRSERLVTFVVLVVASVQIIVSRPRAAAAAPPPRET